MRDVVQCADVHEVSADPDAFRLLCLQNLLASTEERVYFKDRDSRFVLVSAGWLAVSTPGRSAEEIIGATDFDVFSEEHAALAFADEREIIATGRSIVAKVERETFDDRPDAWVSTTKMPLRGERGAIVGTFGISRDVTARVHAERALAFQALHDPLTQLANRAALFDRLSQVLLALDRRAGRVAVLFVDLDNFKEVNDSFGHRVGDMVLVEVAHRLSALVRRGDTVARLGEDEFVAVCTLLSEHDDVRLIAERMVRSVAASMAIGGRDVTVNCSVGVASTSEASTEPDVLVRDADVAMYAAKAAGRNRFRVFDSAHRATSAESRELRAQLVEAIETSELFLVYQPLFRLDDRRMSGVEALVRWRHPARGVLLPDDFVPFAEEHGLIRDIDSFALDEACRQLASWRSRPDWPDDFSMSVNVSGRQLVDPGLADRVAAAIARHAIRPQSLCLEITETALVGEVGDVEPTLARLSALGVRLALDDFGTGYSTLAHLQHLRVDVLKIDRSFVEHIGRSGRDRSIVAAVTAMSHALGMSVVGEGIETDHQHAELASLSCDEGQGFLFARPLDPDAVVALVQRSDAPESLP